MKEKENKVSLKMEQLYKEFYKENGCEPRFADCVVEYTDTRDTVEVIIKLSCDVVEEEDDSIFFYCNGLNDLKSMTDEGTGCDFVITEICGFE